MTGDFCRACSEAVLDASGSKRTMALMQAFTRKVNASLVKLLRVLDRHPELLEEVRAK